MALFSGSAWAGTEQPTGASVLWVGHDPTLIEVRQLLEQGLFAQAEGLLRDELRGITQADGPAPDDSETATRSRRQDLLDALETIRRVRYEFSQTEDQLVEKVRQTIEDFTSEDLRRLVEQGEVTCRVIDGKVCYFRREPGVLYRFCDEIKKRKTEWDQRRRAARQQSGAPGQPLDENRSDRALNEHLAEVARAGRAAAEVGASPIVLPTRFRMRYTLTVRPADEQLDPDLMKAGSLLRVWLPFPQAYRQQSDVTLMRATINGQDYQPYLAPPATNFDGPSPIGGAPQRTAYFETTVTDPGKPIVFEEVFEYTMAAHYPVITAENTRDLTDKERSAFAPYLAERPPHLVFNDELRDLTQQLIGNETNPYLKAKAIFDWWDANIRWLPEFEYGTIPSFADLCIRRKRGDCGVQAVTMMAMMRLAGIPSRWQSGFTTMPGQENLHDWAEVYLPPHGWVVADPSYGYRKSDDPDVHGFYLGHMDAYRLIVNLDYGRELDPPKSSLRSEPADFQRGEVECDGVNLYFHDWSWRFEVEKIEPIRR